LSVIRGNEIAVQRAPAMAGALCCLRVWSLCQNRNGLGKVEDRLHNGHWRLSGRNDRGLRVGAAGEPVDEVVGRPGAGELHLALSHVGAGGGELVLVALNKLAVDEVSDIQHHFAAFGKPAADFFVEGHEEAVHLETDGTRAGLTLARPCSALTEVGQILPANSFGRCLALDFAAATVVDHDLEVHFSLAAELVDVAEELALVGADGLAEAVIVSEDGAEAEGKHGGMLEAVCDDPSVVDAGFLVEGFGWVVLADDNGEIAGWVEEDLVTADSEDGFHRNWLAVAG